MAQQLLAATVRGWARMQVWFNITWTLLLASLLMCTSASAQVIFTSPAISATSGTAGPNEPVKCNDALNKQETKRAPTKEELDWFNSLHW